MARKGLAGESMAHEIYHIRTGVNKLNDNMNLCWSVELRTGGANGFTGSVEFLHPYPPSSSQANQ